MASGAGEGRPADESRLRPYAAGLALEWLARTPNLRHRTVDGSLAFVDISGFTSLTERLAAKGKVGAEEMSDLLNGAFAALLQEAYEYGAGLVKWGGDAVLLLFEGPDHAALACRAAYGMRRTMNRVGRLRTSVGEVKLRMSVGIASGEFDFFLAGDRHRELLIAGPAATLTAELEAVAIAGEIVVSAATAERLPPAARGDARGDGFLLRRPPMVDRRSRWWGQGGELAGQCLDPAIRDHLLTEVGESEHRQVAVGFVEVSNTDPVLREQGAGVLAEALDRLIRVVQAQCAHHRVTFWETDISKDGFKIMLVAGAPRASGQDEEGMLRAARAILDAHSGPVRLRIGVNSGRVFNGGFGPPFRRTWSVKGDAVNTAARIMAKAGAGRLLASQPLVEHARVQVRGELLPPFLVKGKQQPLLAWDVEAVTVVGRDAQADAPVLVGRERELAALGDAWRVTGSGAGSVLAVTGAAGIGKTRLVEEFLAGISRAAQVRGYADAYESATPYSVVGRLVRDLLRIDPGTPDRDVVDTLRERLAEQAPGLLDWLPLIGDAVFGIALPPTPLTAGMRDEFRPARLAAAVGELLEVFAASPTLLVVEDVHSTDRASADLLRRLAAHAGSRPWLIVLVGRVVPDALSRAAVVPLPLRPLPAEPASQLVLAAGGESLPPHLVRRVVDRADGNPLFLIALTRSAAAGAGELPDSVEELFAASIDELPPDARLVVRLAAVLGMRFDNRSLERLLHAPVTADVWRALEPFVEPDGAAGRRFRNGLLRDAAYEGLPFSRRAALHGQAADLLSDAEPSGEVLAALSLHSFAAKRHADAWRYSIAAGQRAKQSYANADALVFFERARTAGRWLPDLAPDDFTSLLEAIGDVRARLADLEPAMQAYREARGLLPRGAASRARCAMSAGLVAARSGNVRRALRWFTLAQRDIAEARDAGAGADRALDEVAARIAVEQAFLRHTVGRTPEARELCERSMQLAAAAGADDVTGRALLLAELLDVSSGRAGDEQRIRKALLLFRRCGDQPREAGAWNQLGVSAYFRGEWDAALDSYREAQRLHLASGDDWSVAIASANIAEILVDQGRLAEAEPLVAEALRVWRVSGTPSDVGFGAALFGRLCAHAGRYDEADSYLTEAAAAFSVKQERAELVDVDIRAAEALLLQRRPDDARTRLEDARGRLREAARIAGLAAEGGLPTVPQSAAVLRLEGVAAVQQGELTAARSGLAAAVAIARRLGSAHELGLALRAVAESGGADGIEVGPAAAEATALLTGLGIVRTPAYLAAPADVREVPIPRQPEGSVPAGVRVPAGENEGDDLVPSVLPAVRDAGRRPTG